MISSVSSHGFKPHVLSGNNAASNAAAAKYLASLQISGGGDLNASRAAGHFLQPQPQIPHQQHQQGGNQTSQHANNQGIQHLSAIPQDSRPYGERSDGSVHFVAPQMYHAHSAHSPYVPNAGPTQLRPAAADSRAHLHLQFGQTLSPMKEAPANTRRFSTGAHQWEDADPLLVAALYSKFFDGNSAPKPDRRLSTGQVPSHPHHRMSGNRHIANQRQHRRFYLPDASEIGPGWF